MTARFICGDALATLDTLPGESVQCIVTSPPYWGLRDYGAVGQIGRERAPDEYITRLLEVFRECRRVLRTDGVCFLNLGDCYATGAGRVGASPGGGVQGERWHGPVTQPNRMPIPGIPTKSLMMMPFRAALALHAGGWIVRSVMPWVRRNVMPESVRDRPNSAVEYVFMLVKSQHYFWDAESVKQRGAIAAGTRAAKGSAVRSELKDVNGRAPEYWEYTGERNFRNSDLFFTSLGEPHGLISNADGEPLALDVNPHGFAGAHFATFPPKLVEPLVKAASRRGDTVLDPFSGAGTVALVCERLGRNSIGIELNPGYVEMARERVRNDAPLLEAAE